MPEPLIPGHQLPDPETVRERISELDDRAAILRRLLRLLLHIESRHAVTDRTSAAASRPEVLHVA